MDISLISIYEVFFTAMSLKIRPFAALYPPPPHIFFRTDTIERGANAVDMNIPPPATTESGHRDRSPINHFLYGVWV